MLRGHPNTLDLGPPPALVGEVGQEGQLEHAHHLAVQLHHQQLVIRVGIDGSEGFGIRGGDRPSGTLSRRTQGVVGQEGDDGRKVVAPGGPQGRLHRQRISINQMSASNSPRV